MHYVGIDLHKRESQICILDSSSGEVIEMRIKTDRVEFARVLPRLIAPGSEILIEASTESRWAKQALESLGFKVIVGDPNYAPMYGNARSRRVKTDRRDARALAEACRSKTYRVAHVPSDEARSRRNLLTSREQLTGMRTASIVTVRSLLRLYGIGIPASKAELFTAKVRTVELGEELAVAVGALLETCDVLSRQLEALDTQLKAIAKSDRRMANLMTAYGVGPVTAVAFASVIDDPKRFRNAHCVEAYLGIVPGENSSGDQKHRTRITKTGSRMMRWLLVQAAITIMRTGRSSAPGLHQWAHKIRERRSPKIARVALARRLAGILFAMMRDERPFDSARFAPQASTAS